MTARYIMQQYRNDLTYIQGERIRNTYLTSVKKKKKTKKRAFRLINWTELLHLHAHMWFVLQQDAAKSRASRDRHETRDVYITVQNAYYTAEHSRVNC
jgi:hypothetical protein